MSDFRLDPTIAYDVIPLPSQGIYYANKKKNVKVAFLTASDENILSSPSLIANNLVVDELLKRRLISAPTARSSSMQFAGIMNQVNQNGTTIPYGQIVQSIQSMQQTITNLTNNANNTKHT